MKPDSDAAKFIAHCKRMKSFNFPDVARGLNMNWHKDLKPLIDKDPEFKEAISELGEELKYELLQTMLTIAMKGKLPGRSPEIGALKEMIKLLDQGIIGGKQREEKEQEPALSEEQEEARLKRLGIA